MPAWVLVAVGGVMTLAGGVFALQGLGYVEGSSMTGEATWAILGPLIAGLGVALMLVGLQRGKRP